MGFLVRNWWSTPTDLGCRSEGGAWSGKDFYKADRAGGLHARRLAKFIVQAGLSTEATVTLQWFPGDPEARVIGPLF